jgi:hypothetical protein
MPSTGTISGWPRKYAESDPRIGRMSNRRPVSSGRVTTTGGIRFVIAASVGARRLRQVVAPISAQNMITNGCAKRARVMNRCQSRFNSARLNTDERLLLRLTRFAGVTR